MRVEGTQFQQLVNALVDAFPDLDRLSMMLSFRLNKKLATITNPAPLDVAVFRVINEANSRGWTANLINASLQSNPDNEQLLEFAQSLGLALASPTSLELVIRSTNSFLDIHLFRTKLAEVEYQVCKIEIPAVNGLISGTGFLVGPDLIISNHHVMEKVINGEVLPSQVRVRFDYKSLATGGVISPGTVLSLAKDWLIDSSPYSPIDSEREPKSALPSEEHLDFALMRLAVAAGTQPIGANPEPGAPLRKWVTPCLNHRFDPNTPLFIVQHPSGSPLKLSLCTDALIRLNGNGTRVSYRTNTEPGSSGSPCFNQNWELVALHHAGDPNFNLGHAPEYNQGIPWSKIATRLARPGIGVVLAPPLARP